GVPLVLLVLGPRLAASGASPSPPSHGGEGRGEEALRQAQGMAQSSQKSDFPSPRPSPHSFLAGGGRRMSRPLDTYGWRRGSRGALNVYAHFKNAPAFTPPSSSGRISARFECR